MPSFLLREDDDRISLSFVLALHDDGFATAEDGPTAHRWAAAPQRLLTVRGTGWKRNR